MSFNLGRASANAATNYFAKVMNGIGQSKVKSKQNSHIKSDRNGHAKSDKVHSHESMKSFKTVTRQYMQYLKDNYNGIKSNINTETATSFLESKLSSSDIKGSSANTYISQISNLAIANDSLGRKHDIDTKEIAGNLRDAGYDLGKHAKDRSFENPKEIVERMQSTKYGLSASLQDSIGLRASDAIDSNKWQVNPDNTLTVHGSKNGISYTTAPLNDLLMNRAIQAKENSYKVSYTAYSQTLREASVGQIWQGTHGLRYSFAQSRFEELKDLSYKERLDRLSLELGHSRAEISQHYLKKD